MPKESDGATFQDLKEDAHNLRRPNYDVRRRTASIHVALLTAGRDKPYALGLAPALTEQGIYVDFIGSDIVDGAEVRNNPRISFFNLRGQAESASMWEKAARVLVYYFRLGKYAAGSPAPVFHLLWNNKFEYFDRTLLMLYYRLLGKRIAFTAHNVNAGVRDGTDSWLNRVTLRIQYRLCHHVFVHTQRMKGELLSSYGLSDERVTVIPFGINNTLPVSTLSRDDARRSLDLDSKDTVLLFFGNIAPYKGVDILVKALALLAPRHPTLKLVIAGRPKGEESYWESIEQEIGAAGLGPMVRTHITYIPDERVEVFAKAADAFVLPYQHVFQSGVLFLGYSFGLPVIATDVGSLREDIVEGETGWVCRPNDMKDLAEAIERWLESSLRRPSDSQRAAIQAYANQHHSWTTVGELTRRVYERVLGVNGGS